MKNEDDAFLPKDRLEVDLYLSSIEARLFVDNELKNEVCLSGDNDISLIKHFIVHPYPTNTLELAKIVCDPDSSLEDDPINQASQIYTAVYHLNSKFSAWNSRIISRTKGGYYPTLPFIIRSGIAPKEVTVMHEGQELIP